MSDLTFNTQTGMTIERELLIAYLNTGTKATPTWTPLGKRVNDSSEDYDFGEETNVDILGNTYTTYKKPTIKQSFDPLNLEGGNAVSEKIWNLAVKDQDYAALAAQDILIVHWYAGTSGTPFAERYPESALAITGLGGQGGGNMEMPIDITYGGAREVGTAAKDQTGAVTFTKNVG